MYLPDRADRCTADIYYMEFIDELYLGGEVPFRFRFVNNIKEELLQ